MRTARGRALAAVIAGTMALAGASPALAATEATSQTEVTVVDATVASWTVEAGDGATRNVAVTVPTSIPLAADTSGAVTGPTTAGFTNTGDVDVSLTRVSARVAEGFAAVPATTIADGSDNTSNAVHVSVSRKGGAAGQAFTLAEAAAEGGDGEPSGKDLSEAGWTIKAGQPKVVDLLEVGGAVAHMRRTIASAETLATVEWTFEAAGE